MIPKINQIDLSQLIKDLYSKETAQVESQKSNLPLNQNNHFNIQQLGSQMNQQQQQAAQTIQEKIDIYIKQKQLQMQQQQNQLQDLVALNSTLQSCNNLLLNSSNGINLPNQVPPQFALDILNNIQLNNSNSINQPNIFNTNSAESNSLPNNSQSNNKKNTQQLNESSLNYSSSAQNTNNQNIQNQVTVQSSKSIMDSCSDISLNCPQTNQTQQKISNSANLISNTEINNNNTSSQQKISSQTNTNQNSNASNSGRWTREEHLRFVKGLGLYGKNWKKVEEYVGTRSGAQIRSHAQKFFNKIQRENTKNSAKQSSSKKSGNILSGSQMLDEQMPLLRIRQQSAQSNFSADIASDEVEGENDQQSLEQYQDIIPQQSNQKDTKEWLHYYRLLQQTCLQNLESQKENQSLSSDQIQQMEEQLKKIQIFIQVLSACDNVSQPFECASPNISQASPMNLRFSFDNLNINSPFVKTSQSTQKLNNNQQQTSIVEINNFSIDGNAEDKQGQKTSKSKYSNQMSSSTSKKIKSGSTSKRLGKNCDQESSSCEFDSQINADYSSQSQQSQDKKSYYSKISKNVEKNIEDQPNQDEDEISDQPTNRPNNRSTSAISSIGQSALSTPENQRNKNNGIYQFGFFNSPNQQNSLIENINLVSDNIDIDSDFNQIKNFSQMNTQNKFSSQKKQPDFGMFASHSVKSPIVLSSPSQQNTKKQQSFQFVSTPIKHQGRLEQELSTQNTSTSSFKLEPSFFTYFVKKYGKYFNDPHSQTPKLSDLVNMNTQYEQDSIIEDSASNNNSFNRKFENCSPKRFSATKRAQNIMELEDDYGKNELPKMRRKLSSFSVYQSQNNSANQNNNSISSSEIKTQPLIGNYQVSYSDNEKQQKINNFRKKLKLSEFSQNAFLNCINQDVEQNNIPIRNQSK